MASSTKGNYMGVSDQESDEIVDENDKTNSYQHIGARTNHPVLKMQEFIKTPPGRAMLTSTVLLILPWSVWAIWLGQVDNYWQAQKITGVTSFFLFSTITPWILFLLFFVLMCFKKNKSYPSWQCLLGYFSLVSALFVLTASSVLFYNATLVICQRYRCNVLKYVAADLGFLAGFSLLVESYLHLRTIRNSCCSGNAGSYY